MISSSVVIVLVLGQVFAVVEVVVVFVIDADN
jgi:hypothetical protein